MNIAGKCIAITGVGGFIGARMAERALQCGMRVKGLEICPQKAAGVERKGIDVFIGDINDEKIVDEFCKESDVVFHTAAIVQEKGDWALFRKVNVEGSRSLAEISVKNGVQQFVHLSSVMVYGFRYDAYIDETGRLSGEENPYCQTKIESEKAVMDFHMQQEMKVTIIRPGDVYGPGSVPWVIRPIEEMQKGVLPVPSVGVTNYVYVDNLIDFIFLVLQKDAGGEIFNVTDGDVVSLQNFFRYYKRMIGKGKVIAISPVTLRFICGMIEKLYSFVHKTPPITKETVDFLSRRNPYSIKKAKDIGYIPQIGLEEGMKKIETWLYEQEKFNNI